MAGRLVRQTSLPPANTKLHHRPRRHEYTLIDYILLPNIGTRHYCWCQCAQSRPEAARYPSGRRSTYRFSTSAPRSQHDLPDHYATLSLSPRASGKEIKKQFYALSKKHHPDVTRNLPENESAQHRRKFESVSEAYHVLGDPEKKSKYDSERSASSSAYTYGNAGQAGQAQYSRGGRPASGLSRRRSTFRGPPPSFYRSGGWGSSDGTRRRQQHAEDTGTKQRDYARSTHQNPNSGSEAGDGGWPFSTDPNDVPHFDRGAHYRTTTNVEEQLRAGRRKRRDLLFKAREEAKARGTGSGINAITPEEVGAPKEIRSFVTVTALLMVGCSGGYLIFGMPFS